MRLFILFDNRCAYCDQCIVGQPEPDHVVPLSRGGSNDIGNILPACGPCNRSKASHTLDEWATMREARDLPPLGTTWLPSDPRFVHLASITRQAA